MSADNNTAAAAANWSGFGSCLLQLDLLQCERLDSGVVCSSEDEQTRTARLFAAQVVLTVLLVPAAVLLNGSVVVTVWLNRQLHTVINTLVVVLCANNAVWTVVPVLLAISPNNRGPTCHATKFIFPATRAAGAASPGPSSSFMSKTLRKTPEMAANIQSLRSSKLGRTPVGPELKIELEGQDAVARYCSRHGAGGSSGTSHRLASPLTEVQTDARAPLPTIREASAGSSTQTLRLAPPARDTSEGCVNLAVIAGSSSSVTIVSEAPNEKQFATISALILAPILLLKGRQPDVDLRASTRGTLNDNSSQETHPRTRPPPAGRSRRVDIVAMLSLSTFLLIFVMSLVPVVALALTLSDNRCAILPSRRLALYLAGIGGAGATTILSPLVLVLFSTDFRQALRRTGRRLARCPRRRHRQRPPRRHPAALAAPQ
ncbi:hypothetical protein FJT64_023710 [Amphibalanus amphitrite]|uniref:Uncharacterized protein n=1 Tax=Amphibalanus amphitrite TaxID=1232801 RepID=A0A6A4WAZ9_AMPAM|nr:hypothetical protein FJT64_023710 [Amphibalanus amphitrite]